MTQQIATVAYVAGIAGLFYLERDAKARTSKALWIPVLWLMIVASRPVSVWLQSGPTISGADQNAEGSPIDAAVFGILIAAGVLVLSLRTNKVRRFLRANLALLLFFSYCAVSIVWSDYSFVAFKRYIKAVGDLVMIFIVLTDPDPLAATKRFLARVAFVLLPLSVLFIKFYPDLGRSYNRWTWIPMYCGVTTFKNELGMTCLVCGLGSLWSFVTAWKDRGISHRSRRLTAHGITLATAVWLLLTADSMTSWSCFIMAGTVLVMSTQRWVARRNGAISAFIGGFVVISLCSLFLDSGGAMVHALGRSTNLTGRPAIWAAVLSLHTNPLLGTGFESFWMGNRLQRVWDMTEKGIQEAHNGYLEVYLNLGMAGVALLGVLIASGYRHALSVFRRDPHAGSIRLAFFTAGVIYSLTEAGFRMMNPVWLAFLLAITAIPPGLLNKKRREKSGTPVIEVLLPEETELAVSRFA